ncbi:radical SAM protein [Pyrinomonas methylaliphatogenes]|jgi:MoaA/NifB/PqqE/SkfB family radical SAM enzyme|uniref:Predicted Fe-S oxidoreductase n=1 Tax=Pyrinomonas methylaliphatogenes TaxID=454194 RepID=A0A0B6WV61_9BACT|nr:radical SAM protein [Pyrinomonas methylaliphatogenes]MBX5477829.1 radical SAM protein [Pyrinomonas methylaliphatogenes]CDM64134.1 predicted Fe-S oxidoreductase [Pyrinomonas methylaliphatogenes]
MKKRLILKNALKQLCHGFNRPFMVMFETTLHCNMKCVYCAIWQNQLPEQRAVRERIFKRMDEAAEIGVFAWSFSGGEPLLNPNMPDYIEYAARKGFYTSMPTNGLALKKYAEACAKLDLLEISIDTLDREKFARRRGLDGLPTILDGLDYLLGKYEHNTIQINAAVDLDNLDDLPALARFCEERGLILHTEAVHNVVRTTWRTENVELEREALDYVAARLMELRRQYKCIRFYKDYYRFYREGGFSEKFPCRSASHLINIRPDGSVQFPCAFVNLHRGAPEMSLREIYASPEVREIIRQSPRMWDFCRGCKIGCPYEVSSYRNSPLTALRNALDFLRWN